MTASKPADVAGAPPSPGPKQFDHLRLRRGTVDDGDGAGAPSLSLRSLERQGGVLISHRRIPNPGTAAQFSS